MLTFTTYLNTLHSFHISSFFSLHLKYLFWPIALISQTIHITTFITFVYFRYYYFPPPLVTPPYIFLKPSYTLLLVNPFLSPDHINAYHPLFAFDFCNIYCLSLILSICLKLLFSDIVHLSLLFFCFQSLADNYCAA